MIHLDRRNLQPDGWEQKKIKMQPVTKKYSNGEVTIVWKNELCIHSGRCFTGLPAVFDPLNHPWIMPEGATTQEIINQVKKCPSGALNFFLNKD